MVLTMNSHGLDVQILQTRLNAIGAALAIDGWYGDATAQAVATFQRQAGLVVDGVAGERTLAALTKGKPATALTEADIQQAADKLGVNPACIKAVSAVESAGSGFLADGRPVILFERHVFYQRLGKPKAETLASQYPTLCSTQRGGYTGGSSEWQRLTLAGTVSGQPGTASESASWGRFQIMGYHWQALGYASVDDFVSTMQASEGHHLDAFVRFVLLDSALVKALAKLDWTGFAKRYNGPAYQANHYDTRLAMAYAQAERHA